MRTTRSAVHIDAPRQAVWRVVTEPAYVEQWQYGSALETDWAVGSPVRFTTEWQGQRFEQWGTVLAVEEPARLRYSLFAPRPGLEDRPEHYFTMTYELTDEAEGTLLTIVQEDPRPPAEGSADGGAGDAGSPGDATAAEDDPVLGALKALAESLARADTP